MPIFILLLRVRRYGPCAWHEPQAFRIAARAVEFDRLCGNPALIGLCSRFSRHFELFRALGLRRPGREGPQVPGGLDVAKWLRSRHPAVKLLLISGDCDSDRIEAHLGGEDVPFLAKPFRPTALALTVLSLLSA
jgi:hypothetical protein